MAETTNIAWTDSTMNSAPVREPSYGSEPSGADVRRDPVFGIGHLSPEDLETPSLSWVICGGESGPGARPMHPNWVRGVRDQCKDAGVPFFFKQWGEYVGGARDQNGWHHYHDNTWSPNADHDFGDGCVALRVGKKKADNVLDGARHMEFPTP